MLVASGLGFAGLTFGRPARSAPANQAQPARAKSTILFFLCGGASHLDMWDLKPNAPSEFRGPFKEISTNVPGIRVSEHLPRCARQMDKMALVRSFTHTDASHGPADHWMMTAYKAGPGFVSNDGQLNNQRPALGAVVAKELGPVGALPAYVTVPSVPKSGGSAHFRKSRRLPE